MQLRARARPRGAPMLGGGKPEHDAAAWVLHCSSAQRKSAVTRCPSAPRAHQAGDVRRPRRTGRPRPGPAESIGHIAYLSFPSGVLRSVSGLDEARGLDFVHTLNFPSSVGDVLPKTVSSKTRHGFVILTGSENAAGPGSRGPGARTDQGRGGGQHAGRGGRGPMRKFTALHRNVRVRIGLRSSTS